MWVHHGLVKSASLVASAKHTHPYFASDSVPSFAVAATLFVVAAKSSAAQLVAAPHFDLVKFVVAVVAA